MRPENFDPAEVKLHPLPRLAIFSITLFIAISVWYFSYRIPLMNPDAPIISGLLLGAELFGLITLMLHLLGTWRLVERKSPPPLTDVSADILITTWNEPVDLLRNTLLAAKQVRYARYVWLLDDGNREEMRNLAEELGIRYLARTDRSHAKAGNLNNALQHTDAEFVAIFDCDHAPAQEFFEQTLGYFRNPKVGIVQTPQDFFNVDSFQHRQNKHLQEYWHEQTLFYRVIQPGKDFWNAAFFCGSCAIARRSALMDIGGVATGTITEDIHTSLRLHKKGWASVYHSEALAFGLSPSSHNQYDTQRLRWGRGAMQVWRKEGFFLSGKLTIAQRLCYLASTLTYFEGWQKGIIYILPIFVLLTGSLPVIWTGADFVLLFLAWLLSGLLVNEAVGRGYTKTVWMEEYNFLRFFTFINATLALVIPRDWKFRVTPKSDSPATKAPTRLWPQFLYVFLGSMSIMIGSAIYFTQHHLPFGAYISNIVWLCVNGAIAVAALHFASRKLRQRRANHRFPIPVPVTLKGAQHSDRTAPLAVADDVSSNGMRIVFDKGAKIPGEISGYLHLPRKILPFTGEVIRKAIRNDKIDVSVKFRWTQPSHADALNACLYGNSLQWDINSWAETREKDFNLMEYWPFRKLRGKSKTAIGQWRIGHLRGPDGAGAPCLVRLIDEETQSYLAASYAQPPSARIIDLTLDGEKKEKKPGLIVTGGQFYRVGEGVVYITTLAAQPTGEQISFHRNPAWMQSAGGRA